MLIVAYCLYGCLTRASDPVGTRTEAELMEALLMQDPRVTGTRIEPAIDWPSGADEPVIAHKTPS